MRSTIQAEHRDDRARLDADGKRVRGFTVADAEQPLREQQMAGRTDRQVFRDALDQAEDERLPPVHGEAQRTRITRASRWRVSPRSSVRMRTASSIGRMKTFPSPILPVFADLHDGVHRALHAIVSRYDLKLHLGQKIDGVFAPAIDLGVPLLPAEALDLRDRHALHADFGQRFFHVFQLEWFDDGLDFLHGGALLSGAFGLARRQLRECGQKKPPEARIRRTATFPQGAL